MREREEVIDAPKISCPAADIWICFEFLSAACYDSMYYDDSRACEITECRPRKDAIGGMVSSEVRLLSEIGSEQEVGVQISYSESASEIKYKSAFLPFSVLREWTSGQGSRQ